jgi:hypothetical protein
MKTMTDQNLPTVPVSEAAPIPHSALPTPHLEHSALPTAHFARGRTGKIARLPHELRHQLNCRLRNGEPGKTLLQWLNSLPEVRAILAAEFDSRPLTPGNLTEWKSGGYRDWLVRQDALDLLHSVDDPLAPEQQALSGHLADKLARWLGLQYAAAAQALVASEAKPQTRWARLRELCSDVTRLRRAELYSDRLDLERQWLALEQSNSGVQKEKEFWTWLEKPEIREKLHDYVPKQEGLSPETLEKIEKELNLL